MNCKNNPRSQDIAIVLPPLECKENHCVLHRTTKIPSPRESTHGHSPAHPLPLILAFIKIKSTEICKQLNKLLGKLQKPSHQRYKWERKSWVPDCKAKGFENYVIETMLWSYWKRENTCTLNKFPLRPSSLAFEGGVCVPMLYVCIVSQYLSLGNLILYHLIL